ncbi:MAG: hypothetical protein AAGA90_07440 [Actinomycetota bacterium]
MSDVEELRAAFASLLTRLQAGAASLETYAAASDPVGLARGYQHLGRTIIRGLEEHLLRDPDHPLSRVLDDRVRTGGDNPDQRYLFAPVRGGERYRVWGRKGSAARIELQLYSREPYGGEDVGVGYLPDEEIVFHVDGTFSVELGPAVDGPSTLVNPSSATILNIRQIYDEWDTTDPGAVFVDRIGWEGARRVAEGPSEVAARWRGAAADISASIACWPDLVQNGPMTFLEPNTLGPLMSPGARAGVVGRWISIGHYALDPGHALVIDMPPTGAAYEGAQLADLWFGSLEYASATSSISGAQAVSAPDGHRYLVLSLDDPGYVNWLDPAGVARGIVHLRYDGLDAEPPDDAAPSARLIAVDDLSDVIPGFAADGVDATARAEQRAMRRRHVQVRYGR